MRYARPSLRRQKCLYQRISRLGLKNAQFLVIDQAKEGFQNFQFGARSGPVIELDAVLHELAHLIQFQAENLIGRIQYGRITFKRPKPIVIGSEEFFEPVTAQGTMREIETFAIEFLLLQKCGRKVNVDDFILNRCRVGEFLGDWFNYEKQAYHKHSALRTLSSRKESVQLEFKTDFLRFLEKWEQVNICEKADDCLQVIAGLAVNVV